MKYLLSLCIPPLLLANVVVAHPAAQPEDKQKPKSTISAPLDLSELQLPSPEEIKAMTDQLPDMGAMLGDMKTLIEDENFTGGMERSMEALSARMKSHTGSGAEPDMTAMFADMLGLMADEDFVGGMTQTLAPLQELMMEHLPEHISTEQGAVDAPRDLPAPPEAPQ